MGEGGREEGGLQLKGGSGGGVFGGREWERGVWGGGRKGDCSLKVVVVVMFLGAENGRGRCEGRELKGGSVGGGGLS